MTSKFIRVKQLTRAIDVFILFPDTVQHRELALALGVDERCGLISAGFYSLTEDELGNPIYRCYGESISLDLQSAPDDSEMLNRQMLGYN